MNDDIGYARMLLASASAALTQAVNERKIIMEFRGYALWCDLGEHAFSPKDRKRATYAIQTLDEDTGLPVEDQLLACGEHAAERRSLLVPKAALPAPPKDADKELYTEFLEWKNGIKLEPESAG